MRLFRLLTTGRGETWGAGGGSNSRSKAASFLLLLLLSLSVGTTPVGAFSGGAGGCEGGKAAVGGNHLQHIVQLVGTLGDGNIDVRIGDTVLDPSITEEFETGVEYEITVESFGQFPYKGVLIRTESNETDLTAALRPGINTQMASVCQEPGVEGVTHVNSTGKRVTSAFMIVDEPGTIALDLTIVGINNRTASVYGYSGFTARFVGPPATTTTPAPVANATESPTASPTTFDDKEGEEVFPTIPPSDAPSTAMPSDFPSDIPTSIPTDVPSSSPVSTDEPTEPSPTTSLEEMDPTAIDTLKELIDSLPPGTTVKDLLDIIPPGLTIEDILTVLSLYSDAPLVDNNNNNMTEMTEIPPEVLDLVFDEMPEN